MHRRSSCRSRTKSTADLITESLASLLSIYNAQCWILCLIATAKLRYSISVSQQHKCHLLSARTNCV